MEDIYLLRSIIDDLDREIEDLNTMRDMWSLRLQMTMDRRSKFICTLSNIMKMASF